MPLQKKNLAVILFEPEYEENIGYAARAMANFSFSSLILVNPKADHLSGLCRSRAMHGKHILEGAKLFNYLEEAASGFDFTIATTAKLSKERKIKRVAISLEEAARRFSNSNAPIALVFGPEKNGLDNRQLALCDLIMHIPASREYPTLSLSHAVAVALYEFSKCKGSRISGIAARKSTRGTLLWHFRELIHAGGKIRNKEETFRSFRSMASRALITDKEAKSIIAVFSSALKGLKRR